MIASALNLGYRIGYALRRSYQLTSMLLSYGIESRKYAGRIAELVALGYTNEEIVACIVLDRQLESKKLAQQ